MHVGYKRILLQRAQTHAYKLPVISGDGQRIAFVSFASDLTAVVDDRAQDVFVRDLQSAVTTLISAGTGATNEPSGIPAISGDGEFVAFGSRAEDLVAADNNGVVDVYRAGIP